MAAMANASAHGRSCIGRMFSVVAHRQKVTARKITYLPEQSKDH